MSTIVNRVKSSEADRQADALSDRELVGVSGGSRAAKATLSPFVFTKHYDKASPVLA